MSAAQALPRSSKALSTAGCPGPTRMRNLGPPLFSTVYCLWSAQLVSWTGTRHEHKHERRSNGGVPFRAQRAPGQKLLS